ncbi:malonate decarboxylase holo-[acyl-carrier-protein] synthase [Rhodobacteraceae bacterium RKSG542]|uniref:malonate decarboxylase holo-[acyl-carrier-protein] synthase n=1 Tax=Pseudovibrio flavus TaxID=2529854 RepID=UPI0012BCE120|nr:malonate decarboxylase holo-[acyl-carrier-protein] synthase [Pseudovibrio flavus]MTI16853.1 malonate decarboxylase holo-[acyl-carrier-protein] synthase [Pseudovibrio flavus]
MLNLRHTLAHFSPDQMERMLASILFAMTPKDLDREQLDGALKALRSYRVPGIVCRPLTELPEGQGQVGFSLPLKRGAQRLRASVTVSEGDVVSFSTPYEVMERALEIGDMPVSPLLRTLKAWADDLDIELGLIGSWALRAQSGLAYTTSDSDIDLVLKSSSQENMREFHGLKSTLSNKSKINIDCEVLLKGNSGIKLDELVSDSSFILCKSITGVALISKNEQMFA